jgi:hypothetical protein
VGTLPACGGRFPTPLSYGEEVTSMNQRIIPISLETHMIYHNITKNPHNSTEIVKIQVRFTGEGMEQNIFAGEGCGVKRPQDANSLETECLPTIE